MKRNRSTTYILPLILDHICLEFPTIDDNFVNKCILNRLINTYIFENDEKKFVFRLQKNVDSLVFLELIEKSIIFDRHESDEDSLVIVLNVPNDCVDSFDKFVNGKYSRICEKDKQSILEFARSVFNKNMQYIIGSVLYKDKDYIKKLMEGLGMTDNYIKSLPRDFECGQKIDIKLETYVSKVSEELLNNY